jgi:hypothetical protein
MLVKQESPLFQRKCAFDVLTPTVTDVDNLFREQPEIVQRGSKYPLIRLRRIADQAKNSDGSRSSAASSPHAPKYFGQPGIEVRDHPQPQPTLGESIEHLHHPIVNIPTRLWF